MVDPSSQHPSAHALCDGRTLKLLARAGCDWLDKHHTIVNQLNVFPVPDGDTGTNMLMTMRNALKEVDDYDSEHAGQVVGRIAHGAMMGSRGNSGTILSQLWQGFAHVVRDQSTLDTDTAYRGVLKPVEGTILTVAREATEEAEAAYHDTWDTVEILERAVARAKDALARTPDMLPILQKAGVVDSGGSGLVYILEGMLRYLHGEEVEGEQTTAVAVEHLETALAPEDELGYGYDVQFILKGQNLDLNRVRAAIDSMGWSTLVVGDEDAIKVHVHVHDPGIPLSYGTSLGTLSDIVVENMQEQYHEYLRERTEQAVQQGHSPVSTSEGKGPELDENDIGVVAVASGEGLARVFRQLGAAELVMGGQTNNPSTQEILDAIQRVPTHNVIVLPNNKNIILAAEQAARLATDQNVIVIPTRSMPQGISALLPYDPKGDLEDVVEALRLAKDNVVTGEITSATRSVELNGVDVAKGQIIGLIDGSLAASGNTVSDVLRSTLDQMCSVECELITLYYGNGIRESEARRVMDGLRQVYPEREFELVYGGQAHYHYILSAE
jgi:DAK2 domain fusion protein YloV